MHKPSPTFTGVIRVGLINIYLQGREPLMLTGEYLAHHLWGVNHLPSVPFRVTVIPLSGLAQINRIYR